MERKNSDFLIRKVGRRTTKVEPQLFLLGRTTDDEITFLIRTRTSSTKKFDSFSTLNNAISSSHFQSSRDVTARRCNCNCKDVAPDD